MELVSVVNIAVHELTKHQFHLDSRWTETTRLTCRQVDAAFNPPYASEYVNSAVESDVCVCTLGE